MGSVRTRKDSGLLFFDFRYQGLRCRELTTLADTAANRKRMEKVLARIETEVEVGTFDYAATFPKSKHALGAKMPQAPVAAVRVDPEAAAPPVIAEASNATASTPTFGEFTTLWLGEHQVEWRRSHIKVLTSTIDGHLLPHFGDKPVGAITKADIFSFRAKLAEMPGRAQAKMSPKRINGILAPLRQILNDAADRHDFVSPTQALKPLKVRKTDVEPFTLDEVERLLATVRPDYRDYFTARFFTGMRTGECHGLKWKYVDFENRLIRIRETFVLGEDECTKTDSSQRDIQMAPLVRDALRRQHTATAGLSEYVFCNREGKPLDNKNFHDRVWYPLLRYLGLQRRRAYQMRHTAATLWLASGEAPEWIARQLGHSSTEMLFRVYSRYVPNLTRRDGSAFERLLASRFATGKPPIDAGAPPAASPPAQPPPV